MIAKPDSVRVSEHGKLIMIRMKNPTGIQNWNIFCRWAFCLSLSDKTMVTEHRVTELSNVEMSWRTFAGIYDDVYWALLLQRAEVDNVAMTSAALSYYANLHVERGLSQLNLKVKKLTDFFISSGRIQYTG